MPAEPDDRGRLAGPRRRSDHSLPRTPPDTLPHRMRILLLQARPAGDPMLAHEHGCFAVRTGLPSHAIVPHDLLGGPPSLPVLREYDALMVGGSGDYYVSKGNLPHFEATLDFLRGVVDLGHPTFASCFGFQSLVRALGGELVYDPARAEVGTFEMELTAEGRIDPLLGTLPARFDAQLGHNDRVISLPGGVVHLASSALCEFQALRIPGKPIWATQFHPELDRETNLDRFRRYRANYSGHIADLDTAEGGFRESPESSGLLMDFLELVFT